jgi:osmotically-inducible protein OsmY
MGYEPYPRNIPQESYSSSASGYGGSSSAREYEAAGSYDRPRGQDYARQGNDFARNDRQTYDDGRYGAQPSRYRRDGGFQQGRGDQRQQGYGRQPQGYDYDDRGFFDRAGDEVRSWFGDDEANRRRDADARNDEQRYGSSHSDDHYHHWRRSQIDALDRDYHEYRQENRAKFDSEFGAWRNERQAQRGSLGKVSEHQEVVGSDGAHVGTVDKVRGDRIILTKNDADAGGRHHSIPSRWIQSVDDKVTISKTAEEAHAHWRDEERNQAFFNADGSHKSEDAVDQPRVLGRSFSGTY